MTTPKRRVTDFTDWQLDRNGSRLYLDDAAIALRFFDIVTASRERDSLPHHDPTPNKAQVRIDRSEFGYRFEGYRLYHPGTKASTWLLPRAASECEDFLTHECVESPTRSGAHRRARLKKIAPNAGQGEEGSSSTQSTAK